ncbi:hypothetical protein FDP41_000498 [Naegleria fowleri]|uniref:Microbial-type PARG catalytic domain-containing protein n=1 Tax=Naegleria fowleri TaxID=5763 RepID=A0A6A5CH25_NAEFO|nr:uncharacterized protein FDP41_000498 [Naegleria fowleri]KAF0984599.1 hypothetical protein FDP41_000498 [Naegleria fowleri]
MGKKKSSSSSKTTTTTTTKTVLGISISSARTCSSKAPIQYIPHFEIYSQILKYTSGREDETLMMCFNKYLYHAKDFLYYYYEYPWKDFTNVRRAFHKFIQMQTILTLLKGKYYLEMSNKKNDEEEEENVHSFKSAKENHFMDTNHHQCEQSMKKTNIVSVDSKQKDETNSSEETSDISTRVVHIDFNMLKKTVKATQRIDASTFPSVMNIGKIIAGDCLETALALKQLLNLNPILLVNGSSSHPGGGYVNGSFAQEEDLCRRSSLALCLDDPFKLNESRQWSYPLPQFGGVYVPQCLVLRKSVQEGYAFLEQPVIISMFSMAAYMNPPVKKRSIGRRDEVYKQEVFEYFLDSKLANAMKQKITSLFEVALQKGHDSLVLSPIGCRAYANPSYHIACLFKEVLQSEFFRNKFKMVLFSVIEDRNSMNNLKNMYMSSDGERGDHVSSCSVPSNQKIFAKVFHGSESGLRSLNEFLQDHLPIRK